MMWGAGWGWFGAALVIVCMGVMLWMMVGHGMGHGGRGHDGAGGESKGSAADAGQILSERFARGEISEEEFERRRSVLESRPS